MLRRRDEHLPPEVAALLLAGELVLPVHPRRTGRDHRLHEFEGVERPAETRLGVGDDRGQPRARAVPARVLGPLDAVGAQERVVDAPDHGRNGVRRVQALVGVRLPGEVGVRGDLPAGQVDRLQPTADHLHGLVPREGAERRDEGPRVQEVPEALRAEAGQGVLLAHAAAQAHHVLGGVVAADAGPPRGRRPLPAQRVGRSRTGAVRSVVAGPETGSVVVSVTGCSLVVGTLWRGSCSELGRSLPVQNPSIPVKNRGSCPNVQAWRTRWSVRSVGSGTW